MHRRVLIGGAVAAVASLAARPGPARAAALNVVVFGDSYSQVPRGLFKNWVTQLQDAGGINKPLQNFAKSGATAAKIGTNHFARQLRLWREAGRPVGARAIVFLGTNDILQTDTFDASKTGLNKGIAELKAAGANLLLIEPLDLGKVPRFFGDQDAGAVINKSFTWAKFVRSRGLPVVRLFEVSRSLLPNEMLFADDLHMNAVGHKRIADEVRLKLAV